VFESGDDSIFAVGQGERGREPRTKGRDVNVSRSREPMDGTGTLAWRGLHWVVQGGTPAGRVHVHLLK